MVKAKDSMRTKALEDIVRILRDHREELCRNYRVRELGIFGSYVRGEQRPDSDVSIFSSILTKSLRSSASFTWRTTFQTFWCKGGSCNEKGFKKAYRQKHS